VYIGQTRGANWIARLEALGFGEMTCRGELPPRRRPFAFDNGAFKDWTAGKPFNVDRYERDLEALWRVDGTPDFLTPPDIVAGGLRSLEFSLDWMPRLRKYGPLYLVVQDGMEFSDVEPVLGDFAGIFVGGSLAWKLRTSENWVLLAHALGKKCHIGRVGTELRVRWARRIGADSIDSCLPLWSDANLRRFLRGFEPTRSRDFFEAAV
jgi:hypothetical protein